MTRIIERVYWKPVTRFNTMIRGWRDRMDSKWRWSGMVQGWWWQKVQKRNKQVRWGDSTGCCRGMSGRVPEAHKYQSWWQRSYPNDDWAIWQSVRGSADLLSQVIGWWNTGVVLIRQVWGRWLYHFTASIEIREENIVLEAWRLCAVVSANSSLNWLTVDNNQIIC